MLLSPSEAPDVRVVAEPPSAIEGALGQAEVVALF